MMNVPDIIGRDLAVLFVGVNPGVMSGATGHHFAHPSSRFWRALHLSGFTPRQLKPDEEHELLGWGIGLTNLVDRPTPAARDLEPSELRRGRALLEKKVQRYRPGAVCVLGIGAYRLAFDRSEAVIGRQPERFAEVPVWVLPGPSGQNAHYPASALVREFAHFRKYLLAGRRT